MTNEESILDWFKNHIWARPKPSNICDGVGSFAIRDIPKGTSIYDLADKNITDWISWSKVSTLPIGVIRCIYDMQPHIGIQANDKDFVWKEELGQLWMYTTEGLNWQCNWFFQNHSDNPNLDVFVMGDREFKYISNRDIKEGEELFESYDSFVDDWEKINKNGKSS